MKILVLCKQRPMGKDLLVRPYGRFYHLAYYLAELGHEVDMLLFNYRFEPAQYRQIGQLRMHSCSVCHPYRLLTGLRQLSKSAPDWVIGFSDIYYGVLASWLAPRLGAKAMLDAYDNYEAYLPAAWPLHRLWHRALARAELVTSAGPALAELLARHHTRSRVEILPMTVDDDLQAGLDKRTCREQLGLPVEKKLVGYHGSIYASRDIDTFFSAIHMLKAEHPDLHFVMAGHTGKQVQIPAVVNYLGYLDDKDVPCFLNSLDTLVVLNKNSAFGNYSYPVKLYEAMHCKIPIVASATPASRWILEAYPDMLVEPGNPDALASAIATSVERGRIAYSPALPTWRELTVRLEQQLLDHM